MVKAKGITEERFELNWLGYEHDIYMQQPQLVQDVLMIYYNLHYIQQGTIDRLCKPKPKTNIFNN